MVKDIIVNLDVHGSHNVAADFAISVARIFNAHLSATGFAYEAAVPGSLFDRAAVEAIETQRQRWETAARTAIDRFEQAARGGGLSVESHLVKSDPDRAAEIFARLARRFDVAVLTQAEPEKSSMQASVIEAALFDSGRPLLVVPYASPLPRKSDLSYRRFETRPLQSPASRNAFTLAVRSILSY